MNKAGIPIFDESKMKETNEIVDSLLSARIMWTEHDLGHASSQQDGL